jgi:YidC/Oxa1 family membrane protein insertase
MSFLYHAFFYDPLLNLLVVLYKTAAFNDLGLSIILLTVLIRVILFPLFQKSARYQIVMQRLQPKVAEIQKRHKEDKTKQTEALLALYRENKTNPFSGFLFILLQLPILIALYQIFINILKPGVFEKLYGFISQPETFNATFLGLINLASPSILMVGLAALAQYFQVKTALPKKKDHEELSAQEKASRKMAFIAPLLTLFIFYKLPAAVSLYWLTASVFSIVQQELIQKNIKRDEELGRSD